MNNTQPKTGKTFLLLCELHFPEIHGKTHDSDPNIETHYLIYNTFDPFTGISLNDLNNDFDYDSEQDDLDSDDTLCKINDDICFLKHKYNTYRKTSPHPTIRNYHNIVVKDNYIKPEIGQYIILPTQESIAILKTFWIRIIQKKWKKIFKERIERIKAAKGYNNLSRRELHTSHNISLPGLKGMLWQLKLCC